MKIVARGDKAASSVIIVSSLDIPRAVFVEGKKRV
jgi:hypothetical protein